MAEQGGQEKTEDGSVALVTGATRGVGRAIAGRLAAAGWRLAVHGRHPRADAGQWLAELPGAGHRMFAADLGEADAPKRLFEEILGAFGRIDLLVNNAAIYEKHAPFEIDFVAWERAWDVHTGVGLRAPAHLSFLAARQMAGHGGGRIVNISSRGAFRGEPGAPAYGAAKAGLNALGQSLAKAFAPAGVLVFTVAPGWIDTDMAADFVHGRRRPEILHDIPLGRVATADEIASIVAWLASEAPESMTGCIIDANGASYLRT